MTALTATEAVPVARPGVRFRRTSAFALVAATALLAVSTVLQPDLDGTDAQRLDAMSGVPAGISAVTFLVAQLPMLVAVLAIGSLISAGAPRLSGWGTTLAFVGAFAHTVFGGGALVLLTMANDGPTHRDVYADVVHSFMNGPAMLFSVAGLLGTVLGLLLLSIGLFRTRTGPRWFGPVLWLFLVVEFVGTWISAWAAYLSALCFAAVFLALAKYVMGRPLAG
jgi:hypothetical protein